MEMKKTAILFLVSAIIMPAAVFASDVAKFALGEWAPYTSEYEANAKFLEEIVAEAFKLEGIAVKYDYFPWKRSYVYVKQGKYDGTFPWNTTPEREIDFHINKIPLFQDDSVYFHLKNNPFDWNTIEDLKNYKVGVTIGYKQDAYYKEKGVSAEIVANEEQNFLKILAGRIDVYQTSKLAGYATINRLFSPADASKFTHHPRAPETDIYYILFSKNRPGDRELADKFDSGFKKLKASGEYDRICEKYRDVSTCGQNLNKE